MKSKVYKKKDLGQNRGRVVSIREFRKDKDSETAVRKSFVYIVTRVDAVTEVIPAPDIRIVKCIENELKREVFLFRVKGVVFFKKKRFVYKVDYLHTLAIRMFWKTHVLSSKPAVLA